MAVSIAQTIYPGISTTGTTGTTGGPCYIQASNNITGQLSIPASSINWGNSGTSTSGIGLTMLADGCFYRSTSSHTHYVDLSSLSHEEMASSNNVIFLKDTLYSDLSEKRYSVSQLFDAGKYVSFLSYDKNFNLLELCTLHNSEYPASLGMLSPLRKINMDSISASSNGTSLGFDSSAGIYPLIPLRDILSLTNDSELDLHIRKLNTSSATHVLLKKQRFAPSQLTFNNSYSFLRLKPKDVVRQKITQAAFSKRTSYSLLKDIALPLNTITKDFYEALRGRVALNGLLFDPDTALKSYLLSLFI